MVLDCLTDKQKCIFTVPGERIDVLSISPTFPVTTGVADNLSAASSNWSANWWATWIGSIMKPFGR